MLLFKKTTRKLGHKYLLSLNNWEQEVYYLVYGKLAYLAYLAIKDDHYFY